MVSAEEPGQTVGESQDENSRESEEHSDAESKGKGKNPGDSRCRWSEATALNGAELLLPLVVSFVALAVSSNHCAQTCALRERDGRVFAAACFSRQASVDQLGLFARPGAQDHTPAHAHRQWRTRSPTHGHLLTTCARSASTQECIRVRVWCCARAFVCLYVSLGVGQLTSTLHICTEHTRLQHLSQTHQRIRTGMVTEADMDNFQRQLRQEMADVIQEVRAAMTDWTC